MLRSPSWILMPSAETAAYRLPQELRAQDPYMAVDCGWVDQMLPFINRFTKKGDFILDPFAGFGTTAVAAASLGRHCVGIELNENRVRIATLRLRQLENALDISQCDRTCPLIVHGDASTYDLLSARCALSSAMLPCRYHLLLTNVPYWWCRPDSECSGSLYDDQSYSSYLSQCGAIFRRCYDVIEPGGHAVVMCQNLQVRGKNERFTMVPQAWDVGRILSEAFDELLDEVILLYPHGHSDEFHRCDRLKNVQNWSASPAEAISDSGDNSFASNRCHEYALIARKKL